MLHNGWSAQIAVTPDIGLFLFYGAWAYYRLVSLSKCIPPAGRFTMLDRKKKPGLTPSRVLGVQSRGLLPEYARLLPARRAVA